MFDCLILGAGPGGYVAAIRASQLGLKTAIIEKDALGGTCLNWGCIPTKSLLRTAEIIHLIETSDKFGLSVQNFEIHFEKIIERSRNIAKQLAMGVRGLLKKNNVEVIEGFGVFENANTITVTKKDGSQTKIDGKNIIIATGAKAKTLTPPHSRIWTSKEALNPPFCPKSLIVLGSGAIGIEFASFFKHMKTNVSVVEMKDRILPLEDFEVSDFALKAFQKQGIQFHLNQIAKEITPHDDHVKICLQNNEILKADAVLVAIGVSGNTTGMGLEKIGIHTENNQIIVDKWCQTSVKNVYAIGDVAGAPWLAHKASHEGIICVEKIAGLSPHPLNKNSIPGCTYSLPQIASIGLTEQEIKDKKVKIGRFPFKANGKALALGEGEGFIKVIFDAETGELLGAHLCGSDVTELIQGFAIAKTLETTEEELMNTIFPHPTLSEMIHEAVLNAFDRGLHY
jgi:dihydrolipoamide dehydrogenase